MNAAAELWTPFGSQPANDNRVPPCRAHGQETLPLVVALSGVAGSGKSTAAQYLIDIHGYTRVRFAGPLKAMCRAIGMTDTDIEGSMKEHKAPWLGGKSPRQFMQLLGTEFGRKLIYDDFWVNLWRAEAESILDAGGHVVVDDCRFPNEAATVRKMGGDIYRIIGRGGLAGAHESERLDFIPDLVISNEDDILALWSKVDDALTRYA